MPPRRACLAALTGTLLLTAACAPAAPDDAPWKGSGSVTVVTAAPDAGGPLSFRNCPTLEEARAAVPIIVSGPDANAVPFKTMLLQCGYTLPGTAIEGSTGIWILVFDASAEGVELWASARSDPAFPNATDIAGLGDRSFSTGTPGQHDLWVVGGNYGFHMYHSRREGVPLDAMSALARAMLTGLERPPR